MKGYTGICRNCIHDKVMTVNVPCSGCIDIMDLALHRLDVETEYANYQPKEDIKLMSCPECKEKPTIGYACGEYFIVGNDKCEFCGYITEMHSSKCTEANMWNRMEKSVEYAEKAEGAARKAEYWENKAEEITLAIPESLEYFTSKLNEAVEYHKDLKDGTIERTHAYSLAYATKDVKELKEKVKIAELLWGMKGGAEKGGMKK